MRFVRSDRVVLIGLALLCATAATPLAAQDAVRILSTEYSISGNDATLRLELSDGRTLDMAIRSGAAYIDGARIGDAARGSALDREWRELLNRAMDTDTEQLPQLLRDWSAGSGGDVGARMDAALEAVLAPATVAPTVAADAGAQATPLSDSVVRLRERIAELERTVQTLETRSPRVERATRPARARSPFRHIGEGVAGLFSTAIAYAVLFGIAFLVIMFGGRRYIEGVADTARHATGRSFLVGLAATFLVVPAFVLGIIALAISIVGIPGILLWLPGFPIAVCLAIVLGYLGVAHALGESFAERRFYVTDWFQRGNSYYFLLTGLGVLLAAFFVSQVVHMAGPWLRGFNALLIVTGILFTIISAMIGFGAVLISRGGREPVRGGDTFVFDTERQTEETGV